MAVIGCRVNESPFTMQRAPETTGRYFVADANLVVRAIGTETILVPVTSGVGDLDSIYTLSEVASRVWSLLRTPITRDGIVAVICAEYDVTADVAAKDVDDFLAALITKSLVRAVPAPLA
jgi:hypothetical protein